jgi:SCP-2 sterol transfer family protein
MLGGLIEANVTARPEKRADFDRLRARVGISARDAEEAATLDFEGGHLTVSSGLRSGAQLTITADSETVLQLSNLKIGPLGMPVYVDETGRSVVGKLLTGRLRIQGMTRLGLLNRVTRIFSVV